jgi:hypothetical protein
MKLGEHGGFYGSLVQKYRYKSMEVLFRPFMYDKGNKGYV